MTSPKVEPPKDEVKDKIEEILEPLHIRGCREQSDDKYHDCVKAHREAAQSILAIIKLQQEALLDKVVEEIAIAERMAWTNVPGTQMETKVFQTNMKASIDKLRLEL